MTTKVNRPAGIRKRRSTIRRRVLFGVAFIVPILVGYVLYTNMNTSVEKSSVYRDQGSLVSHTDASRVFVRSGLKAAAHGFVDGKGDELKIASYAVYPGYQENLAKIGLPHASGVDAAQPALQAYGEIAARAVGLATTPGYSPAAVLTIIESTAYLQAEENAESALAAALFGLSKANHAVDQNWRVLAVLEMGLAILVALFILFLAYRTERAIKRADDIEAAREQDRQQMTTEPFTQVIGTMDDGVLVVSSEQVILLANPRAQLMLGPSASLGATFPMPPPASLDVRALDGSMVQASVTTSTARSGGRAVRIVTVRAN